MCVFYASWQQCAFDETFQFNYLFIQVLTQQPERQLIIIILNNKNFLFIYVLKLTARGQLQNQHKYKTTAAQTFGQKGAK
jgi:hypothetical protein